MGKNFKTYVTLFEEASIDSYNVASIIEEEMKRLLGSKDRFIHDGMLQERDYRFNGSDTVREATEEEIELYNAFRLVYKHFRSLK